MQRRPDRHRRQRRRSLPVRRQHPIDYADPSGLFSIGGFFEEVGEFATGRTLLQEGFNQE